MLSVSLDGAVIGGLDGQRVVLRSELGLNVGTSFAKMNRVGTDVSQFHHPISTEIALQSKVPLLRIRDHEIARDGERKQEVRRNDSRTPVGAADVGNCDCRRGEL